MKSPFVNEIEVNQTVTACFLVHSKEIREKKTGEPYLSLLLGDKTGKIDAKMWDNVGDVLTAFERDSFVKVKGAVQLHLNRPQITVHKLRLLEDGEIDFADFFPATTRNVDEMWSELRSIVSGVRSHHIRELLNLLLDDSDIAKRLRQAPAAKTIHHAFLGGLLEHVLSLANLCIATAPFYPFVDLDLLIAGAVLHDIGKIHELSYDRGFGYTAEGQLLGHMMIALRMIGDKIARLPDFPEPLRTLIEHIVISHHGHLEFGSPKLPLFPEAMLFHQLDELDSKMETMRHLIDSDRQTDGCFTTYSSSLERTVLKKERFLNPDSPKPLQAAPSPPKPVASPSSPFADALRTALVRND